MLSIIVAKAKNNVIGKNNALIWSLPEDLKRFKKLTTNHNIIMGRRTFESLGRILPNRYHIILSNDCKLDIDDENVEVLEDASMLKKYIESDEENFVIGGATIYKILMPYCTKMYITEIDQEFEGDVYFPEFSLNDWKVISKEKGLKNEKNPFDYNYVIYEKNN